MAKYQRTEGICLRRIEYSNTSQVATFLTPDAGRLPFICKGIRRSPKRGISRGLELAVRYGLVYYKRHTSSLYTLTEHSMIESYRGVRQAIERTLCTYYAVELMRNFTSEGAACPRLYRLMVESLRRFSRGQCLGLSVLFLEIGCLRDYGALPTFDRCAECGRELGSGGRLTFSAAYGGPLCRPCDHQSHHHPGATMPVRGRRLKALAALAARPLERPGEISMEPAEIVAASRLLRFHIRYLLGKELTMWKYLHGRHLSHSLRRLRPNA